MLTGIPYPAAVIFDTLLSRYRHMPYKHRRGVTSHQLDVSHGAVAGGNISINPIDSVFLLSLSTGYTGVFWDFQSQLPVCVDPARWLERWRLTLENPYTVSVDPMLTTGGIPVITPEPVALSCVTSQCARSSGLLVRSE